MVTQVPPEEVRAELERRIDDLRALEREYRSRLRAYLMQQLGTLNMTGEMLDGQQRQQAEHARAVLARWIRKADAPPFTHFTEGERWLADQLGTLLSVIDEIAPKAGDHG